jgi:NAD(P)-dependent dehydrogenase (short-subunit alcohol dehydrogenase family)
MVALFGLLLASSGSAWSGGKCSGTTTASDVAKHLSPDMSGRSVFMTGGDSGIGLAAATAIAATNATLAIGSLSPATTGAAAAAAITKATGNAKVNVYPLDLSSFASVQKCAAMFLTDLAVVGASLDVLVNDAGIDHCPASLPPMTEDGYERVFQVNYLGHWLLTELMLPVLAHNLPSSGRNAGRIINVASGASGEACTWAGAPKDCEAIANLPPPVRDTSHNNTEGAPTSNYGLTKFLQIYHSAELAARAANYTALRSFSMEPGFVDTPMTRQLSPATRKRWCSFQPHCPLTAEEGASTLAFMVLAPDAVLPAADDGAYFAKCEKATPPSWDAASQKQLFDLSANWTDFLTVQEF